MQFYFAHKQLLKSPVFLCSFFMIFVHGIQLQ